MESSGDVPLADVRVEPSDPDKELASDAAEFMRRLTGPTNRSLSGEAWGTVASQQMLRSLSAGYGEEGKAKDGSNLTRVIHVTLEWRGLSYSVPLGGRGPPCCRRGGTSKTILRNMSSTVPPGRLVAIMGPTGCGKTSLVNALAGRLPAGGSLEGEILVNGIPRGRGFRTITAYVMQDDVLFHNLTVLETFQFAARIRLPSSVPAAAKEELVNEIITQLGLAKVKQTHIGNAFVRGVSGGERKRVNIGIEIIRNPSLIFLDEPTSGLDAFQAHNVMESLWGLAQGGRSVVTTIHQPRSSIFKMFDLLLLLSEGRQIYVGDADQAVNWFSQLGYPCPAHYNPADFFADVVAVDFRSPKSEEASRRRIELLVQKYDQGAGEQGVQAASVSEADVSAMRDMDKRPGFSNNMVVEFKLLLQRAWKQQSRDRIPQIILIMQTVIIGFVLAALYSQMEMNQAGVQDEIGVLFFTSLFEAMTHMLSALNTFPTERGIINRERAGKAYHVLPYYLSRFICDLPLRVLVALLFANIIYWIIGLNPSASAFFIFLSLIILDAMAGQALGVAVSAACKTEKIAFAVAPAATIILVLFSGFFVSTQTIPIVIRWIQYISHLYYVFMGLCINDFRGRTGWSCEDAPTASACITTGDQILNRLGFQDNELWEAYVGLACLVFGYNLAGYLVLRFTKPRYLPLTKKAAKKQQ